MQDWQKSKFLRKNSWVSGLLTFRRFGNWTFGFIYCMYGSLKLFYFDIFICQKRRQSLYRSQVAFGQPRSNSGDVERSKSKYVST